MRLETKIKLLRIWGAAMKRVDPADVTRALFAAVLLACIAWGAS